MGNCQGESLVTAAATLAIAISQGNDSEELTILAAFFTALGDNLALLAAKKNNNYK